jgi:pimeloyl-ACP methyl ester carboxylesterase
MTRSGTHISSQGTELAWLADGPEGGADSRCGLFWLGGFMSDMEGSKAEVLAELGRASGRPCLRFDYSGHGKSGGVFRQGTISHWLGEAVEVFCALANGPRVIIGSSMGGWLALLLVRHLRRERPDIAKRVAGLVLIAPAADMTHDLMWAKYDEATRTVITEQGYLEEPSDYGDEPYVITRDLIEDGRQHLMLEEGLDVSFPVRILQGEDDPDVPWQHVLKTFQALRGEDVTMTLVKHGDHRLSTPVDLVRLKATCLELCELADMT